MLLLGESAGDVPADQVPLDPGFGRTIVLGSERSERGFQRRCVAVVGPGLELRECPPETTSALRILLRQAAGQGLDLEPVRVRVPALAEQ